MQFVTIQHVHIIGFAGGQQLSNCHAYERLAITYFLNSRIVLSSAVIFHNYIRIFSIIYHLRGTECVCGHLLICTLALLLSSILVVG